MLLLCIDKHRCHSLYSVNNGKCVFVSFVCSFSFYAQTYIDVLLCITNISPLMYLCTLSFCPADIFQPSCSRIVSLFYLSRVPPTFTVSMFCVRSFPLFFYYCVPLRKSLFCFVFYYLFRVPLYRQRLMSLRTNSCN